MAVESLKDLSTAELTTVDPFTGRSFYLGRLVEERDDLELNRKVVVFERPRYIPLLDELLTGFRRVLSEAFKQREVFVIDRAENFKSHILKNFRLKFVDAMGMEHLLLPVDVVRIKSLQEDVPPFITFGSVKNFLSENRDLVKKIDDQNKKLAETVKEVPFLEEKASRVDELEHENLRLRNRVEQVSNDYQALKIDFDRMKVAFRDLLFIYDNAKNKQGVMTEVKVMADAMQNLENAAKLSEEQIRNREKHVENMDRKAREGSDADKELVKRMESLESEIKKKG